MKYFIAVLALAAVASARVLDNHFLPTEGQFDIHPAVDIVSGSQVSQSASPLVQIILNIESNDVAPLPVAPIVQPIVQPIGVEPIVPLPIILPVDVEPIAPLPIILPVEVEGINPLPIILPVDVEGINPLPIILPIDVEGINPLPIILPIDVPQPGHIVDTVSVAEPIYPGQIVDTISVAEPILPGPIGIIGIPEILN